MVLRLEDTLQQGGPRRRCGVLHPLLPKQGVHSIGVLDTSMIAEHEEQAFEKSKESLDEFLKNGSGWVFDSVSHLEVKTSTYPLAPSSYIPLPSKLAAKKALINIKNVDQKEGRCFCSYFSCKKPKLCIIRTLCQMNLVCVYLRHS
ncbi:hypothetical protein AVEN_215120-1 [Araneus ventricosus]|uniref:Uncharacterized protein n=1 Tax=Araneus ventricosus TaxID=182803 RepID=A0A4Y2JCL7_ARAVE|nr:hypothetical protein AVEN_215120-1 [Araneus ventricosus]